MGIQKRLPVLYTFHVCLLLLCLIHPYPLVAGSKGRDFYLAFMEMFSGHGPQYAHPSLTIINPNIADVKVQIEYAGLSQPPMSLTLNGTANNATAFSLSTDIILSGAQKHSKHVHVTSTGDIYVHCEVDYTGQNKYSETGFMVLPTYQLSLEYIVATYCDDRKCLFLVTSVEDNNTVTVALRIPPGSSRATYNGSSYSDDSSITESLNAGESMQVTCYKCDLTGSWVRATKRVAVFNGGQFTTTLTTNRRWSDAVAVQMIPIEALGSRYVLGAKYPYLRADVKVVLLHAGDHFTKDGSVYTAIRDRSVTTFTHQSLNRVLEITGSTPMVVMEVVYAASQRNPDLCMNLPLPRNHWSTDYLVYLQEGAKNLMFVVLPRDSDPGAGIEVSGDQPDNKDEVQYENYTLLTLTFTSGGIRYVHFTLSNSSTTFWAFLIQYRAYKASSYVLPYLYSQATHGDPDTTPVTTAVTTVPMTTDATTTPVTTDATTTPVTTDVTTTPVTTDATTTPVTTDATTTPVTTDATTTPVTTDATTTPVTTDATTTPVTTDATTTPVTTTPVTTDATTTPVTTDVTTTPVTTDATTTPVTTDATTTPVTTDATTTPVTTDATTTPVTTDATTTPVTTDATTTPVTTDVTTTPVTTSATTTPETTENGVTTSSTTSETNTPANSPATSITPIQTTEDDVTTSDDVTTGKDTTTPGGVLPKPTPSARPIHCCRCVKNEASSVMSPEERETMVEQATATIKATLQKDKKTMSAFVRSKQSVADQRVSSTILGTSIGIICFAIFFTFLIGSDVIHFIKFFKSRIRP